jgi:GGDEF domain-containing protein
MVTVDKFDRESSASVHANLSADEDLATKTCDLVSLMWSHFATLHALHHGLRLDLQSGALTRRDLLSEIESITEISRRHGEPVAVLSIGICGIRGLDDAGRWSQRDALIEHIGGSLRSKVRSDDLIGRFADDQFVVVLRRLDGALARRVTHVLLETANEAIARLSATLLGSKSPVIDGDQFEGKLNAYAGLVLGRPENLDAQHLLRRSIAMLDRARREGVELAFEADNGAERSEATLSELTAPVCGGMLA